ncbi:hypothetical protein H2O64_04090 [Kordia sp. YSTF-M3]|uniref:Uncharacterized protein n=1 Tax=Kordia aestuariivivens TaxID=2759037 RepID=A0ABR7Q5K1_9FLAO|nr:hypothetical protein [Kordia aestuariivivens]MBC8753836.1 hypothetical protein [Kordia aestuariivivens]
MPEEDYLEIDCKHGKGIAAVVCCHHVASEVAVGFIEISTVPKDLQAWCYACEFFFLEENDKTEKFLKFNKAELVCEQCYAELKDVHQVLD